MDEHGRERAPVRLVDRAEEPRARALERADRVRDDDAAGRQARADELEELLRHEVRRDRVREERVDHDHVPLRVVLCEEAPAVTDLDLEAWIAGQGEPAIGDVDDGGVDLQRREPQVRELAEHPLLRGAGAEADVEDVPRVGVVREPEVEEVGVAEPRAVRVVEVHRALDRVVEAEVARVVVLHDGEPVVLRVLRVHDLEARVLDDGQRVPRVEVAVAALAKERRPVAARRIRQGPGAVAPERERRDSRARGRRPGDCDPAQRTGGERDERGCCERTPAPRTSSCSMPTAVTSQNEVANTPTMLPAVEIAKVRPAVAPARSTVVAWSRTAIGPTAERITLSGPKSTSEQRSGSSRGPGSHASTASITAVSRSGTRATATPPAAMVPTRSAGTGQRSPASPPSQ